MRAGALRHRITVQSNTDAYDDYGDLSNSWDTGSEIWGSVNPISGKEEDLGSELVGVVTHFIKVRYRASISVSVANRIVFDSRVFQIESVRNWQERNVFLELLCKEVTT